MERTSGKLIVSTSDLVGHLACAHLTVLDGQVSTGGLAKPERDDPELAVLTTRGLEHEARYLDTLKAEGLHVVEIAEPAQGTDRLDALIEFVPRLAGAVVVTIPADASYRAVRRAVEVVRTAGVPILGVIENMSGYRCGQCATAGPLFTGDAGERLAREASAPLLARVPFDPRVQSAVDGGSARAAAEVLARAAAALRDRLEAS